MAWSGCDRSREPSGKYVPVIRLAGSGEEWTETVEFKPNGICYYGHPPKMAECKWSRRENTITISRNGVVLNELQYDGKQLVDPQTAGSGDRMSGKSDTGRPHVVRSPRTVPGFLDAGFSWEVVYRNRRLDW
jgi:hypothetical protein